MRHQRVSKKQVGSLCAEVGEGDGQDPHWRAPRRSRRRSSRRAHAAERRLERKAHQLCRQVAVTLDEVFAECGDSVLRGLHVVDVVPYPDASRLLATVTLVDGRPKAIAPADVLKHLERASGHLRCEITAAVTRKRAPLLLYRVAAPALAEFDNSDEGQPAGLRR
jgi:ribosome-binding factor A